MGHRDFVTSATQNLGGFLQGKSPPGVDPSAYTICTLLPVHTVGSIHISQAKATATPGSDTDPPHWAQSLFMNSRTASYLGGLQFPFVLIPFIFQLFHLDFKVP